MPKHRYVCVYPFEITADLKPWAQRPDVKWVYYKVGDPVPEKVVKASPDLLGLPDRAPRVQIVED